MKNKIKIDDEHNRFLFIRDGYMHFGCINPFCCHGNPGIPNHWELPMDIPEMTITLVLHKDRQVVFSVTLKRDVAKFKKGDSVEIFAADNLSSYAEEFKRIFTTP